MRAWVKPALAALLLCAVALEAQAARVDPCKAAATAATATCTKSVASLKAQLKDSVAPAVCSKRVSDATAAASAKTASTMDGMKKKLVAQTAAVDSCNTRLQRAVDSAAKVLDSVRTALNDVLGAGTTNNANANTKNAAALPAAGGSSAGSAAVGNGANSQAGYDAAGNKVAVRPGVNVNIDANGNVGVGTDGSVTNAGDPATGDDGTADPADPPAGCQASLDAAYSKLTTYARMYAEASNVISAKCPPATGGADPKPWTADCAANLAATNDKINFYAQELDACRAGREPASSSCQCGSVGPDCTACEQKLAAVAAQLAQKCPATGTATGTAACPDVSEYKNMITDLQKRLQTATGSTGVVGCPDVSQYKTTINELQNRLSTIASGACDYSSYKDTISALQARLQAGCGSDTGTAAPCDYSKYTARIADLEKKLASGGTPGVGVVGPDGTIMCPVLDCPMCPAVEKVPCPAVMCPAVEKVPCPVVDCPMCPPVEKVPCPAVMCPVAQCAPCPGINVNQVAPDTSAKEVADLRAKIVALTATVAERDAKIKSLTAGAQG